MQVRTVGESVPRSGGVQRVTGAQEYAGDISIPGMLHARLLRLECGRARIRAIETGRARSLPGVHAVLTAAGLPQPVPRFGTLVRDQPLLADGEVKFHGEPVAVVLADDPDTAAAALELIRVELEELPGIYTLEAARDPLAPLVQDPATRSGPYRESNLVGEWRYGWGSPDEAALSPALVVEGSYTFPMVQHFALEPYACVAAPDGDGVAVWTPIQHPFTLRRVLAEVLSLPLAKVRVAAVDPGGGFGGKGYAKIEPIACFLALACGRPVRLATSLSESLRSARRATSEVRIRTGLDREGRILYQDVQADYLAGAYADVAARVTGKASMLACGPYRTPHTKIHARTFLSHTAPSTAFRGFGGPQLIWAVESQMDEAARRLGLDRVQIRLRNLPARGESLIPGDTPVDGNWAEGLQKAADALHWGTPLPPGHGRGIAIGIKSPAPATVSQAMVRLHVDGSATVLCGTTDMGQGARSVMAQIAAELLQIPYEQVKVVLADTDAVPFDLMTASSRSTVTTGTAVVRACEHVKQQVQAIAAGLFGVGAGRVDVRDGAAHGPDGSLPYAALLARHYGPGMGEVVGTGEYRGQRNPDHPLGGPAAFWEVIFTGVEVVVDPATGQTAISRMVNVSDIGRAINPRQAESQDEGGSVMGIGHALMEELLYDEKGRLRNGSALDYRVPTAMDTPAGFVSILVENGDGPGPFGAKGVGESGILAVAPAVASAVTEATGVVIRDLPLTPERIWRALHT